MPNKLVIRLKEDRVYFYLYESTRVASRIALRHIPRLFSKMEMESDFSGLQMTKGLLRARACASRARNNFSRGPTRRPYSRLSHRKRERGMKKNCVTAQREREREQFPPFVAPISESVRAAKVALFETRTHVYIYLGPKV